MPDILTIADYVAVRAAIDTKLTPQDLPDDVIAEDVFVGRAESEVKALATGWAALAGDDLAALKRAVVYITAALLMPSVIRLISKSTSTRDMSYSRAGVDVEKRVAELRNLAEREIENLDAAPSYTTLTAFARAPGARGQ